MSLFGGDESIYYFSVMAVTGIILAGGKSSRMGADKGRLALKSKPLIAFAIEALSKVAEETIIIANNSAYDAFGLPVYPDLYPETGPLGGICTGLTHSKTETNLVVSCDTPLVNSGLLRHLLDKTEGCSLAVCSTAGAVQPLVGMYAKSMEPTLKEYLLKGQLAMRKVISQMQHTEVEITEDLPFYHPDLFFNVNRPEDLENAKKLSPPGA